MSNAVWKYAMEEIRDEWDLRMPAGARVLTVAEQHGHPTLWALVSVEAETVTRRIAVYGTRHPVDGDVGQYIGTVQQHGGALVWHFFDEGVVSE